MVRRASPIASVLLSTPTPMGVSLLLPSEAGVQDLESVRNWWVQTLTHAKCVTLGSFRTSQSLLSSSIKRVNGKLSNLVPASHPNQETPSQPPRLWKSKNKDTMRTCSWGMTRAESRREAHDKGGLAGPGVDGGFPGYPPGPGDQPGSRTRASVCVRWQRRKEGELWDHLISS